MINIKKLHSHKLGLLLVTTAAISALLLIALPKPSSAVTRSDWRAGEIINDAIFFNKSAMSVDQIQAWLNAKVPTCDTWGTKPHWSGGTRADYGRSQGVAPPYICLKDYYENPTTHATNFNPTASVPSGSLSAAQIIWTAARDHNISPMVLLATLQKEAADNLISDDWPWPTQYRSAMGFGCPDTAPCDAEYYGFFNQMYNAAKQFRRYATYPQEYRYKAGQTNFIQYNPNAACGGTNVFINNQATAGLYNYTPYQPNAAALNNLYGEGDGCSAYGNRNFWRIYNDWFGSTAGTPFFAVNGHVYMTGAGNTYYGVPSQALADAYGINSLFGGRLVYTDSSYLAGKTNAGNLKWFARFDEPSMYAVTQQGLHHFPDESTFLAYGHSFGQETILPNYMKSYYTVSSQMQRIAQERNANPIYFIENGKKRHISSEVVYYNQGSPTYSSRPKVQLPRAYLDSIPTGAPLLTTGDLTYTSDTKQYGLYTGSNIAPISSSVANAWKISTAYSAPAAVINQIPSTTTISSLYATAPNSTKYLLTKGVKYPVSDTLMQAYGGASATAPALGTDILDRFQTKPALNSLIRNSQSYTVYVAREGSLYHIPSEQDLTQLGYTFADVSVVDFTLSNYFHNSGIKMFANGRLVRENNSLAIYLINGTLKKQHIPSEDLFLNQYGYNYGQVSVMPQGYLNGYSSLTPLGRTISTGSDQWIVDTECRWKVSDEIRSTYGYTSANFLSVESIISSRINACGDMTNLIRPSNSPKVYLIENGKRRWISSEAALQENGYSWSQVRVVSPSFAASLPIGETLQ